MKKLAKNFLMVYGFVRVLRRIPEVLDAIKRFLCIVVEFTLGMDPLERRRRFSYPNYRDHVNYNPKWWKEN